MSDDQSELYAVVGEFAFITVRYTVCRYLARPERKVCTSILTSHTAGARAGREDRDKGLH